MILATVYSINNVPIRLTDERWEHIVDRHPYMTTYYETMLAAVEGPEYILRGQRGTLQAVVSLSRRSFLHVMYRELHSDDGFIISAYIKPRLNRRLIIWRAKDQ